MRKLKTIILSWLLHHGNCYLKHENFYRIKTIILKKYASLIGYEYQEIEGKECYSCDGTGIYTGRGYFSGRWGKEPCYKCYGTGMYVKKHWNALAVYKFGNYSFHSPIGRQFVKPEIGSKIFEGYISHNSSYWSRFSQLVIFILFDFNGYKKRWRFNFGGGKRKWSFRPATIINNIVYIRYHWRDYLPKRKLDYINDDLPF
ncbi:MAG: hypothetical protein P4L31_07665 [Candidatus Babeliales bacterium]|nr:hypothetical protein [Candidatus Babeliales bacterium]